MGEIKIKLSNETESTFRKSAMDAFGYSRGSISAAAEEAIRQWAASRPEPQHMTEPVSAIRGMLKHVKKSSVALQHELGEIRESHGHRR